MTTRKCLAGCGKTITSKFAICTSCEGIYGKSQTEWPEWLSFLWNSVTQDRFRTKRILRAELDLDISDIDELISAENFGCQVARHRGAE